MMARLSCDGYEGYAEAYCWDEIETVGTTTIVGPLLGKYYYSVWSLTNMWMNIRDGVLDSITEEPEYLHKFDAYGNEYEPFPTPPAVPGPAIHLKKLFGLGGFHGGVQGTASAGGGGGSGKIIEGTPILNINEALQAKAMKSLQKTLEKGFVTGKPVGIGKLPGSSNHLLGNIGDYLEPETDPALPKGQENDFIYLDEVIPITKNITFTDPLIPVSPSMYAELVKYYGAETKVKADLNKSIKDLMKDAF